MNSEFWHQRWGKNDIGFHQKEVNPLLVKYFEALALRKGSRVFLPLCGKTLDIHWLLSQGYRVAGAELSPLAIEQLFAELGLKPKISSLGKINRHSAENIDIFVGDIFDLSREQLAEVDAVYDRAALVAFPEKMRPLYTKHLTEISHQAPQFLICFEYDPSMMEGPPFSIPREKVEQLYQEAYEVWPLARVKLSGGLKGKAPAQEVAWHLQRSFSIG